jgi:hypothetical protein
MEQYLCAEPFNYIPLLDINQIHRYSCPPRAYTWLIVFFNADGCEALADTAFINHHWNFTRRPLKERKIQHSPITLQRGDPGIEMETQSGPFSTSKFSLSKKPRFNRPVGERNHFWRLMLIGFWQGALPAPAATWSLRTTQPRYFAPTCSEVVNLTGLLKPKD